MFPSQERDAEGAEEKQRGRREGLILSFLSAPSLRLLCAEVAGALSIPNQEQAAEDTEERQRGRREGFGEIAVSASQYSRSFSAYSLLFLCVLCVPASGISVSGSDGVPASERFDVLRQLAQA